MNENFHFKILSYNSSNQCHEMILQFFTKTLRTTLFKKKVKGNLILTFLSLFLFDLNAVQHTSTICLSVSAFLMVTLTVFPHCPRRNSFFCSRSLEHGKMFVMLSLCQISKFTDAFCQKRQLNLQDISCWKFLWDKSRSRCCKTKNIELSIVPSIFVLYLLNKKADQGDAPSHFVFKLLLLE